MQKEEGTGIKRQEQTDITWSWGDTLTYIAEHVLLNWGHCLERRFIMDNCMEL